MGILSVQSHVSYGHVGNAAAVFILRRLGHDVWPVHTVLFSNHPGYGDFGGEAVGDPVIQDILGGLERRGLFGQCEAVIGGYLGRPETGEALLDAAGRIRAANPNMRFYLDTVMGDRESGLYVSDTIVSFYRDRALAEADVIKANAFELEILSGQPVRDLASARDAALRLIDRHGTGLIIATSVPARAAGDGTAPALSTAAITRDGAWVVTTPVMPVQQKGAGDAFMALCAARDLCAPGGTGDALALAVSSLWGLMRETHEKGSRELLLVESQHLLQAPDILYEAQWLAHGA